MNAPLAAAALRRPSSRQAGPRAAERLVQHIVAGWRCQALHAAVQLGLPERLADGARSAPELAEAGGADPDALQRLLRALCTLGVCTERTDGRFGLTPSGRLLCPPLDAVVDADALNLRALVQWWGGPLWPMWGELSYSVQTGRSAREKLSGHTHYGHLGDPAVAQVFHGGQRAITSLVLDDLARWPGWRGAHQLVDVGGGHGQAALGVLRSHGRLQATVFDQPHAAEGAGAAIVQAGLAPRCRFQAGSFFEHVPAGADVYLLKSILHNWDDAHCRRIVQTVRRALPPHGRMLLVERVRPDRLRPGARDEAVARTDLNMLAGLGGRERSVDEYAALLAPAGLVIHEVQPLGFEFSRIEVRIGGPGAD